MNKRLPWVLIFLGALGSLLAATPRIENNAVVLDGAIAFKAGTAELAPESGAALKQLAAFLREKPTFTRVRIEGHVAAPDRAAAQKLSEARARAVAAGLVALGVECARLLPVGFGSTKPAVAPAAAPANTRIEIKIAALRGRAIGGMPEDGGGAVAGDPCKP
ncbi:MAG: OmpA family protein [Opitutaceae bacterium]|nr:OmpA family protein [Opitutaceae bacterium]